MCNNYTDLNNAYPKDSFLVPWINQLVNATFNHKLLTFMDVFFGYNQRRMIQENEEHATLIIDKCLYCYKIMPFGLKNTGAIYQRMINKIY